MMYQICDLVVPITVTCNYPFPIPSVVSRTAHRFHLFSYLFHKFFISQDTLLILYTKVIRSRKIEVKNLMT